MTSVMVERSVTQTFHHYFDRSFLFIGPRLNPKTDAYVEAALTPDAETRGSEHQPGFIGLPGFIGAILNETNSIGLVPA